MKKLLIIFALLFSVAPLLTEVKAQAGESELPDWGFDYGILWEQWDDWDREIHEDGFEPSPLRTSVDTLTLMTYNVLHEHFQYKKHRDKHAEVISLVKPDVVGLQELIGKDNFYDLRQLTEMGGTMIVTHIKTHGTLQIDNGIGIMWKYDLGTPNITFKKLPDFGDHVAYLIAEFRDFCFITTHYPNLVDSVFWKREQTTNAILDDNVVKRCKNTGKPIYVSGDFNSDPEQEAIKIFTRNGFNVLNPDALTYPTWNKKNKIKNYTGPTNKADLIIEYNENNPSGEPIDGGIPDFPSEAHKTASDHCPYYVKVKLK